MPWRSGFLALSLAPWLLVTPARDPEAAPRRILLTTELPGDTEICLAYPKAPSVCVQLSVLRDGMEQ